MNALKIICLLIACPFIALFAIIFLTIYLFLTITCIGPLINLILKANDNVLLSSIPNDIKRARTPQGYDLAIRYSGWAKSSETKREGAPLLQNQQTATRRHYPVAIPNGLAATLLATSLIHERLVAAGFEVVSFDRYGVGFSDANTTGRSPTVDECVRDSFFCMEKAIPNQQHWHLVGPSMGAIVAQCMIAQHPEKVVGFLNMDGFPAAFENKREKFLQSSFGWRLVGLISWTGIVRFIMSFVSLKPFSSATFSEAQVKAQFNNPNLFSNTYLEFPLMLDLALSATQAWGPLAISNLSKNEVDLLVRVRPSVNGQFENGAWRELPRSAAERGDDWLSDVETNALIEQIKSKPHTPIAEKWGNLAVRVMNGRDYNYPFGADSFYEEEMRDKAAAEGTVHAILAGDGARYAFPLLGHDKMFTAVDAIVQCMIEIDDAAARLNSSNQV